MPQNTLKIAIVCGLRPLPDYGTAFYETVSRHSGDRFEIMAVTSNSILYPITIWLKVLKIRPQMVHVQNEINMFGGPWGVLLLPLLLVLLKVSGFKIITTVHALPSLEDVHGSFAGHFSYPGLSVVSTLMRWGLHVVYCFTSKISDKVVVHSEGLAVRIVEQYEANREKIVVIPPLVLTTQAIGSAKNSGSPLRKEYFGKKIILCFGYLMRRKGLEKLLEGFKSIATDFPNSVLVIAGQTAQKKYRDELDRFVNENQLNGRVIFTGFLESSEVFSLYQACEFVVLPAVYSFSASSPYLVAVAFGKPVMAPDIGYFSETIRNEEDGLLYNPDELFRALRRLAGDAQLRNKLSSNIEKRQKDFEPDLIARQTLNLYLETMARSS